MILIILSPKNYQWMDLNCTDPIHGAVCLFVYIYLYILIYTYKYLYILARTGHPLCRVREDSSLVSWTLQCWRRNKLENFHCLDSLTHWQQYKSSFKLLSGNWPSDHVVTSITLCPACGANCPHLLSSPINCKELLSSPHPPIILKPRDIYVCDINKCPRLIPLPVNLIKSSRKSESRVILDWATNFSAQL